MKKHTARITAELCGAVIGAGFASGREIAAFFARFGGWSWAGAAAAAAVIGLACRGIMRRPGLAGMPEQWCGTWKMWLWRGVFTALLAATGGAMLAAGGEIASLLVPVHGARVIGLAGTLGLAWYLTKNNSGLLQDVSGALILCLLAVMAAGVLLPQRSAVGLHHQSHGLVSVVMGMCYGGFNAALAAPVIAMAGGRLPEKEKTRCAAGLTALLALLLACGNGVLMRHTALQDEALPFVMLLSPLGRGGYVLGCSALYLAALTTLTACLRGIGAMMRSAWWSLPMVALLSLGGLERIVGVVYPVLGGVCFLVLGAALMHWRTKM